MAPNATKINESLQINLTQKQFQNMRNQFKSEAVMDDHVLPEKRPAMELAVGL